MCALTVSQRAVGCVVGSIVADAAGVPLHWLYDREQFNGVLSQHPTPEFLPKSYSPFYNVPTGTSSCYGNQAIVLLKSLVDCSGFDKNDYKQGLVACFGPGTVYDVGPNVSRPLQGPWTNGSIKVFLENMAAGNDITGKKPDAQADGFSKVAPLVALHAGNDRLLSLVDDAVRVTQDDDTAVGYAKAAALIMEQYVLHGNVPDVVDRVSERLDAGILTNLQEVLEVMATPHVDVVDKFGVACSLPGSFQGALHGVLTGSDVDFATSVRRAVGVRGDNCARAAYVGACAGALVGINGIPKEWIDKTLNKDIVGLSEALASLRT